MQREQWDQLLAEYATGGLPDEQKKLLLAAAMENQEFFDQLMEEDSLREVIELPGARDRLIRSLEPEPATEILPLSPSLPSKAHNRPPLWLAWAAGVVLVLFSGAITYRLLQPNQAAQMLAQRTTPSVKEFPPPPSPAAGETGAKNVDTPPDLLAMKSEPSPVPSPLHVPVPDAPPPPESAQPLVSAVGQSKPEIETRSAKSVADAEKAGTTHVPSIDRIEIPPVLEMRRQEAVTASAPAAASEVKMFAAESTAPVLWRRTGDAIWTRVASGESVARTDTIAIRYTPRFTQTVALVDNDGRRVLQQSGRAGQELDLIIPRYLLSGASGNSLALSLVEGSQPMGAIGGVSNRKAAPAPPRFRIILPLK